jgi:hypothetical protein
MAPRLQEGTVHIVLGQQIMNKHVLPQRRNTLENFTFISLYIQNAVQLCACHRIEDQASYCKLSKLFSMETAELKRLIHGENYKISCKNISMFHEAKRPTLCTVVFNPVWH